MSQHWLPAKEPGQSLLVGYDRPLDEYFAQLHDAAGDVVAEMLGTTDLGELRAWVAPHLDSSRVGLHDVSTAVFLDRDYGTAARIVDWRDLPVRDEAREQGIAEPILPPERFNDLEIERASGMDEDLHEQFAMGLAGGFRWGFEVHGHPTIERVVAVAEDRVALTDTPGSPESFEAYWHRVEHAQLDVLSRAGVEAFVVHVGQSLSEARAQAAARVAEIEQERQQAVEPILTPAERQSVRAFVAERNASPEWRLAGLLTSAGELGAALALQSFTPVQQEAIRQVISAIDAQQSESLSIDDEERRQGQGLTR